MEQDLTKGNLWKQILVFSFPLMISNVLQVLFNMADVAVVGRFAGSIALGAVGSTTTLVTLFTGLLIGMAGGVNVLVARFYGAKKEKDVQETTHTAVIICLLTGILIMALGLLFANGILELLHTKDELIEGAALYLRIYFLGCLHLQSITLVMLYSVLWAIRRSLFIIWQQQESSILY